MTCDSMFCRSFVLSDCERPSSTCGSMSGVRYAKGASSTISFISTSTPSLPATAQILRSSEMPSPSWSKRQYASWYSTSS